MDDTSGVDVFQPSEDLIQEVLDELLFERSGREESVKIGTEELGDKVAREECKKASNGFWRDSHVL